MGNIKIQGNLSTRSEIGYFCNFVKDTLRHAEEDTLDRHNATPLTPGEGFMSIGLNVESVCVLEYRYGPLERSIVFIP